MRRAYSAFGYCLYGIGLVIAISAIIYGFWGIAILLARASGIEW